MSIPQQAANTRLTPNPGPLPTEQAMGAWFAVAAARSQMQELAQRREQQQLRVQMRAHRQAHPQQPLQLSPLAAGQSQGRRLSRTQQVLQAQLLQHQRAGLGLELPRTGQVQATSSPAASSPPSQPQQAQFTNPADSMAAAVAIAGAHNLKPVVSSQASSSPSLPSQNLPSQPPPQA